MAHITRRPFLSHLRAEQTDHVVHLRRGKAVHEGAGIAFWFRPLAAALSEVPIDDRELPLLFHARTRDFQDVTVQASVTYRFNDPGKAARRLDFSIDLARGAWRATPLDQVAGLLTELAQQHALGLLATLDLTAALAAGVEQVRERVAEGLGADQRLAETGIGVVGVRVVAITPEPEVERALRTPAREAVQQEADRAGYERRALAVERERAISENELQSRIELAIREEQLVTQQGANDRRRATEEAEAARIATEADAGRRRTLAAAKADEMTALAAAEATRIRDTGKARADAEAQLMRVHSDVDARLVLALALRELAGQQLRIGQVNLTPELLTGAVARLLGGTDGGQPGHGTQGRLDDGPAAGGRAGR